MKKEYKIRVKFFYIKVFSRSHYRRVNPSRILLFHRPLPEGFLLPSGFISRPFTYYSTESFPLTSGFISRPFTYYSPEGFPLPSGFYFLFIYLLLNRKLFSCLQALFPVHLLTTPPKAFLLPSGFISRPFTYYSTESFPLTSNFALFSFPLLNRRLSPCLRDLFPVHLLTTQPKAFPLPSVFTYCSFLTASSKAFPLALSFPICVSVYQKTQGSLLGFIGSRQRLSLPGRLHPSTFRAEELNFCVRDENRWFLFAIVTAIVLLRVSAVITFTA